MAALTFQSSSSLALLNSESLCRMRCMIACSGAVRVKGRSCKGGVPTGRRAGRFCWPRQTGPRGEQGRKAARAWFSRAIRSYSCLRTFIFSEVTVTCESQRERLQSRARRRCMCMCMRHVHVHVMFMFMCM